MKLKLTATGSTHDGKGVCRYEGKVVFAEGLVKGETALCEIVSTGKKFDTAKVVTLLEESPERIKPDCPVYENCGGCNYRHINYKTELSLKAQRVKDAFRKIANFETGEIKIHPAQSPLRNKATFRFENGEYGFYEAKSHKLVNAKDCKIIHPVMKDIAKEFCNYGGIDALSVRVNRDLSEVSLLIEGEKPDMDSLVRKFPQITAVNLNGKNIYGKGCITDTLCGNTLNISPQSFYQINPPQAELAYKLAYEMSGLNNSHTALDLCCGIGSITLFLAKNCKKVYGAEIVPQAIENAEENAKVNGIDNAFFTCNDAAKALSEFKKRKIKPDIIFVDPPRAGLDAPCKEAIVSFAPEKIAYISCDCATQARDAAFFFEHGYKLTSLEAVDFFPRTAHIETIACFARQ